MTDSTARIRQVLDRAEAELRELGAEAFRSGDDPTASQAHDIVLSLKTLRVQMNGAPEDQILVDRSGDRKTPRGRPAERRTRKARNSNYPRYEIRNGSLIRVGWSKKKKTEYEHKVSQTAFDRTVASIAQIARSGRGPFTAEQIIEQASDANNPIPNYQVYLVIGLLRKHGCVEQVGREGYLVEPEVQQRARQAWANCGGAVR